MMLTNIKNPPGDLILWRCFNPNTGNTKRAFGDELDKQANKRNFSSGDANVS